ncbi:MAG: hypothetical protein GY822_12710 [Deltaproteobacteria bacterium]|nr:hypothetical protein [Deltaproteobacteria bacterium]
MQLGTLGKNIRSFSQCALLVGVLSSTFLAGCSTPTGKVNLQSVTAKGDWAAVLQEHTRSVRVWNLLLMEARLHATLVTPSLRASFLNNRQDFHGRFAKDLNRDLVDFGQRPDEGVDAPIMSGPEGETEILVLVSFYVANREHKDLNDSYSVWDTRLVRGDATAAPLKIDGKRNDPAVNEVLPYVDRFDDVYLLHFPLASPEGQALMGPSDEPLRLELRSAIGNATVSWELLGQETASSTKPL